MRDEIEGVPDPVVGLTIPASAPGVELARFYPPERVPDYDAGVSGLRAERREYLARFDDLRPKIRDTALTTTRASASPVSGDNDRLKFASGDRKAHFRPAQGSTA